MSLIVVLFLLGIVNYSLSEDFYISEDASCSNADDRAWFNTATNWANPKEAGKIGPGDTVHICGTFIGVPLTTVFDVQGSGSPGSPITILFEQDAILTSACFGGYATGSVAGAISIYQKEWIVLDGGVNGIIESTQTGTIGDWPYYREDSLDVSHYNIPGNLGVSVYVSNYIEVANLTINTLYQSNGSFNSFIFPEPGRIGSIPTQTGTAGIFVGGCDYVHVHHNKIDYVGIGIRVGVDENTGVDIDSNYMMRCGIGILAAGKTTQPGVNVRLRRNEITDVTDWGYNDGIKIFANPSDSSEEFHGLEIYQNIIGPFITPDLHPGTAWILADQGWIISPHIYGNILVAAPLDCNDARSCPFINVGGITESAGFGRLEMNARIHDNTIISFSDYRMTGIWVYKDSSKHEIYNNMMYSFGSRLYGIILGSNCEADYIDNNLYYMETLQGNEMEFSFNSFFDSMSEWTTATGWDANSINQQLLQLINLGLANVMNLDGNSTHFSDHVKYEVLRPTDSSPACGNGRYDNDIGALCCGSTGAAGWCVGYSSAQSILPCGMLLLFVIILIVYII